MEYKSKRRYPGLSKQLPCQTEIMTCLYLFFLLQLSNLALALPPLSLALLSPVNTIFPNDTFTSGKAAVKGQSKFPIQSLVFDVEFQA